MTFKDLGLIDPILKALRAEGYTEPTPIQREAIPPALAGRDVLGCARTGTGKTCAFAAPILQRLNGKNGNPRVVKALILTPTRELAIQIGESFAAYGRNLSLRAAVIFGGVGQGPQADAIRRGLDILVATPGRLLDLQGQGLLDLSHIEIFVLDEADRMLDMGFIHDVRRVLRLLPREKQTLLFSATMPPEVMDLVNALLRDYARVEVDPVSKPVEAIRQSLYYVDRNNKTRLLAHLLEALDIPQALVFSRTKHGANRIARDLSRQGISAAAIHGNKSQGARVQALGDFKAGKLRVLVATDIAARGIDIAELGCVFNYDLPDVPETYVHRIGRTGRAGRGGMAVSFCHFGEKDELKAIEKLLGKPIPVVEGHPFPMVNFDPPVKDPRTRPAGGPAEARAPKKPRGGGDGGRKPEPEGAGAPLYTGTRRGRGERQGRLEDTLPAKPAMPAADFVKPNPLDSDIILDATARLLAPRGGAAPKAGQRPAGGGRPNPAPRKGRGEKGPGSPGPDRREKDAGGHGRQRQAEGREDGRFVRKRGAEPMGAPQPKPASAGRKKRQNGGKGPRPIERSLYAAHQKDSTEQRSLMRPYYIEHDD